MRPLQTAVCVDCDLSALLAGLGVHTIGVCRTLRELFWALGYRPDLVVATGPAELADRIRSRELATYPAIIFTEVSPDGRINCEYARPEPAQLQRALNGLCIARQRVPERVREKAAGILARLGVREGLGRDMLLRAILLAYLDRKLLDDMMGGLYAVVGESFGATPVYAKQRIYRTIERAWTKGDASVQYELFLNTIDDKRAKPTNTEMIALIADILRLEGYEWRISKE